MTPANESRGVVVEFDRDAGYGTVRGADGRDYFLHCTCIADDSRTIAGGTPVRFRIAAGHLGRWEARDVRPG